MKIIVGAKYSVDHNIQIRINKEGTDVETQNIKFSLNPFDEVAIEAAIRLKEQSIASEVIAISIGTEKNVNALRSALALGVDRAILVKSQDQISCLNIAEIFKQIIIKEQANLALLGQQSIDSESNQIGAMLAYKLNWPLANFTTNIKIMQESPALEAIITQKIDEGSQDIKVKLPCVINCDLQLNEPRFAKMMDIVNARRKPIEEINLTDFTLTDPLENTAEYQIIKLEAPTSRNEDHEVIFCENVEDLLQKLKNNNLI